VRKPPKFAHLVLKPTLACTARCPTCSTRKDLHVAKGHDQPLELADWKNLFREVQVLGLSKLTLSGGEPTLYGELLELVDAGKDYGWEIGLNTNGSLIDRDYARRLKSAGLNAVSLSVYSAQPDLHDRMRGHPGLWQKAVRAANEFVDIRERQDPSFRVQMQTLLCRENFKDFSERIRLAYQLRVCGITFSYLEGDYQERQHLLNEEQIQEFKRQVVPEAVAIIRESAVDPWTKRLAMAAVRSIFPVGRIRESQYAQGIYRAPASCEIPSYFAIVLANGDVHPCNMVEYSHSPVIGNLRTRSFTEMWNGDAWAAFRAKGFDLCQYCPVPHQVYIPILRRPEVAWAQYLLKHTPFRTFYLPAKRMVFSRRALLRRLRGRE
jgi:MoaA/NifB/PqqE/SkfB family radical SAM enzyme